MTSRDFGAKLTPLPLCHISPQSSEYPSKMTSHAYEPSPAIKVVSNILPKILPRTEPN